MQSAYTGHITPMEWRWVIFTSIVLILVAFLPFLWVAFNQPVDADWQFMGILHQYNEGVTFLSKVRQGLHSTSVLTYVQHTPDPHESALIYPVYPLLGQISRLSSLSPVIMFHLARLGASLFMFIGFYQLGSDIWVRIRARRIFFIFLSLGSGLGWLGVLFTGDASMFPDLSVPQTSAFFSGLVNVHYPLALGCLAMMAGIIITVFRPGFRDEPNLQNGGVAAFLLSLALAFIYPEVLVPLGSALIAIIIVTIYKRPSISKSKLIWGLWVLVPAMPMIAYYLLVYRINPVIPAWLHQRGEIAFSVVSFVLVTIVIWIVAAPAIKRGIVRFEADTDRFMLLWLAMMLLWILIPGDLNQQFLLGVMIPLAYFSTRSIEDFWLSRIQTQFRPLVIGFLSLVMVLSNLYVLMTPVLPLVNEAETANDDMVLEPAYRVALEWLNQFLNNSNIVLASPSVSQWIPVWTNAHVVYGSETDTINASKRRMQVTEWYATTDDDQCDSALIGFGVTRKLYRVDYVLVGPRERALGEAHCADDLRFLANFGDVDIYLVENQLIP